MVSAPEDLLIFHYYLIHIISLQRSFAFENPSLPLPNAFVVKSGFILGHCGENIITTVAPLTLLNTWET